MSELNDTQKRIAELTEGMVVVDAGPGTGKTHTIVQRYVNIVTKEGVSPSDVLLMTFTRAATSEMEERIKRKLTEIGRPDLNRDVRAMTFDAFCLMIVSEYGEEVSDFFGIKEALSRAVTMEENESLSRKYFKLFFDGFNADRGEDYGDSAVILSQYPDDLDDLLRRLMTKGIIPLKNGWFGIDPEKELLGDSEKLMEMLRNKNVVKPGRKTTRSEIADKLFGLDAGDYGPDLPADDGLPQLSEELLESIAREDRGELLRYIHDIYFAYIRRSISDNRLNFGLTAMFAFILLYDSESVREEFRQRYLMIDEFQDTNASQLMIALMVLSEPNLCAVGDWKQGIYGFRYVSIDNITDFEARAVRFRRFLNDDFKRVAFSIPEVAKIPLDINYRSSQKIIDESFQCLKIKGSEKDGSIDEEQLNRDVVRLRQGRDDLDESLTSVRYLRASKEDEADEAIRCVREYMWSGNYEVCDRGSRRPMKFKDIAIICRTTKVCRLVMEAAEREGIPAFLQGDVEIMSTREGKLALAWLRYVNNERDDAGYPVIMADIGYPLVEIRRVKSGYKEFIPPEIDAQRKELYRKRRRVTDLLTHLYSFYGLDNDITHAIITTLSSVHRGSLMTLSDLAMLIEDDIANHTAYTVEASIDRDAVTIMTMHKSKGLEFPAVIIPYMDSGITPPIVRSRGRILYDELTGIRCADVIGRYGDYSKVCRSWRTALAVSAVEKDFSEERRIMFVAVSRAKQYVSFIAGKPSQFMKDLSDDKYGSACDAEAPEHSLEAPKAERPLVSCYRPRRRRFGVHDIMDLKIDEGQEVSEECDEFCGKGMQYGTDVHEDAERMFRGIPLDRDLPEHKEIRKVLDSIEGADLSYAEMECGLPFNDIGVTVRGIIDLIAIFPDRVEIHDYKTDEADRFEDEYKIQLSVYAHAASGFYGRKAVCQIDYVSQGRAVRFDPLPLDVIGERVRLRASISSGDESIEL